MDNKRIVVFGATSAIAQATLKLFAGDGYDCCLVARNENRLEAIADDLKVRGAGKISCLNSDLSDTSRHEQLLGDIKKHFGEFDIALFAYGTLSDQKQCESSFTETFSEMNINFLSVVSLLTPIVNDFENRGNGTIAVISSVAGDRGRQSNYVYGTAKGALSIFLQGLRNRLSASNVNVLTIKPGFVDTPMTSDFKKGLLWASPDTIARGIARAIQKKKDVVYLPWFWQWIMLIIRLIPEQIFKKLKL